MGELPSTLSAVGLFVALSYTLTSSLFALWRVALRKIGKRLPAHTASAAFNAIITSSMLMPLLSLYLLSLTYGPPGGVRGIRVYVA